MALVSSMLVSQGVTDFDISADPWGPSGYGPIDEIDAYVAHGKSCFMYGGMGWDDSGKPQFYLWGPWP